MSLRGPVEVCRRWRSSGGSFSRTSPAEGACDEDLLCVGAGFRSVDEAGFSVLETWIGRSLRRF
jgi:hypothetical protein